MGDERITSAVRVTTGMAGTCIRAKIVWRSACLSIAYHPSGQSCKYYLYPWINGL